MMREAIRDHLWEQLWAEHSCHVRCQTTVFCFHTAYHDARSQWCRRHQSKPDFGCTTSRGQSTVATFAARLKYCAFTQPIIMRRLKYSAVNWQKVKGWRNGHQWRSHGNSTGTPVVPPQSSALRGWANSGEGLWSSRAIP